jgi:hypothetical protein
LNEPDPGAPPASTLPSRPRRRALPLVLAAALLTLGAIALALAAGA